MAAPGGLGGSYSRLAGATAANTRIRLRPSLRLLRGVLPPILIKFEDRRKAQREQERSDPGEGDSEMIVTSSVLYEEPWKPCRKRRTLFGLYDPNNLIGIMQLEKATQEWLHAGKQCGGSMIANHRLRPSQASSRRSWARMGRACDAGSQDQAIRPDPGQR
jgi:hypothetical protein